MNAIDTIYALASGAGVSALSVIRISGSQTRVILQRMAGGLPAVRRATVRRITDPSGSVLDEAIVVWMPAPHSFTGEDCAEFHVHGSRAVQAAVFHSLSGFESVRLAEAGEFTRRAVVNGKLDLVQAEGLGDLLVAQTEAQRSQAVNHMLGTASSKFDSWRERLLSIRADLEAALDFSDEQGVAEDASIRIDDGIRSLLFELKFEVSKSAAAETIRDGVKVVLAGLPNTGKSSLLNAIAQRDAAIVSSMPGTTRDVIEVFLDLGGVPVILTDTAGLRAETTDEIESEGMRRTRGELGRADIAIWVMSPDVSGSERYYLESVADIVVCNKQDLLCGDSRLLRNDHRGPAPVMVSAKSGAGIPELMSLLTGSIQKSYGSKENATVVSRRQRDATQESIRYLNDCLTLPAGAFEIKAEYIRQAADAIGRITGRTEVEEWLGAIFSRFCIGK